DLLAGGQAEAGAGVARRRVQPLAQPEDPLQVLRPDADAVVAHPEQPAAPVAPAADLHPHRATGGEGLMSRPSRNTPVRILLVEDSPDDADLMTEALKERTLLPDVHLVEDGEEAMAFLHGRGRFVAAPRPHLILLDLHLPRKSGFEVLAEAKQDPELR